MANNFPAVPADLALASVEYDVVFPQGSDLAAGLTFTGVTTLLTAARALATGQLAVFYFDTPGDFGAFDQDAAEAALVTLLDDCVQFLSDATGDAVSIIKPQVTVTRLWTWQDPGGSSASFTDSMAYPPAS